MPDTLITCQQVYYKTPSEVRGIAVDMRGVLRQGEILTGSPTITATGLTASAGAVFTTSQLINGQAVEAGQGVSFAISAGSDGSDYLMIVSCGTSQSQTVNTYCILKVRVPTVAAP